MSGGDSVLHLEPERKGEERLKVRERHMSKRAESNKLGIERRRTEGVIEKTRRRR